tara:strand:+ start:4083 stop:4367 length:285 start_codon:yes stop_codon:yes gene_type:complete
MPPPPLPFAAFFLAGGGAFDFFFFPRFAPWFLRADGMMRLVGVAGAAVKGFPRVARLGFRNLAKSVRASRDVTTFLYYSLQKVKDTECSQMVCG